ncbi:MAG: adenosylcobalamin-dependent ribonucleoside-diphosphate reductase [Kiritimatiellaeota bacterium]|nr:adenosylcobalamin-dependent ribonucleoside-diphosphate reductase [Kiritimatiellota bacterium]
MQIDMPAVSRHIWETKYRYFDENGPKDRTVSDTWRRVARAAAGVEKDPKRWEKVFYGLLDGFRFLPGGRILANAGTERRATTMFNCYVMGTIADSIDGIFTAVKEAALTQKQGGGVGFDFSTIRPRGSFINGVDSAASGPLSFMRVLDATCRTIMSAGQRRGAQMGIMRCDHPDIDSFVVAKREDDALRMFNLSVAVTDAFMTAVREDADWDLVFEGRVHRTVKARAIWEKIMRSTYEFAEPGVFMVDRVNEWNNLYYCEEIRATNPCGEQPLPPYGACLLGSLNLTRFVVKPFEPDASIDLDAIATATRAAVRFLDNIIEISRYPLKKQEEEARAKRRMGIGITGLADMLILLGLRYGSREAIRTATRVMRTITHAAYEASVDLAAEKGAFPVFDAGKYLEGKFIQGLPIRTRNKIARHGIRNSHLTSIAPTGTISLLAGNVSSGIEPVFAWHYVRKIRRTEEDDTENHEVMDYAYHEYCRRFGRPERDEDLPPAFVTAADIPARKHIDMQAALQKYVDSAISKTINVPEELPFEQFKDIYLYAYDKGLKGCTTFRPNPRITGVLRRKPDKKTSSPTVPGIAPPVRPPVLHGTTYKIKTPMTPNALYVTINDIEENGTRRPYEIFINTKNLQHFGWIVAMTRLISAVFRREPNPSFLVEELTSIYDPSGGYFSAGEYVPSLPAELGRVIRTHLERLGILTAASSGNGKPAPATNGAVSSNGAPGLMFCPVCQQPALYAEEGCLKCRACGYSKCG